jgi:hypothetical protein
MIHHHRARNGVLLYFALGLMLVLAILGGIVWMLGRYEHLSADQVRRSEALTAMGEAVLEEAFLAITQQLNVAKDDNKIYKDVREPKTDDIKMDGEYLEKITPNSRKMIAEQFRPIDPKKDIQLAGRVTAIEPFDVKGFTDPTVVDKIEKHASLELEVFIRWEGTTKTVAVQRPFKVVKVVMPVFSETTMFINNAEPKYFAKWPSLYGYNPAKFPEEQPSIELDNGWHGYAKSHKKSDFIKRFEEDVIPKGRVPPGRVFIAKGIVPLTNGDRASGALQKTFHSGESELLPAQAEFPLKVIKEQLAKYGFQPSPDPAPQPGATGNTSGSAARPAATPGPTNNTSPSGAPGQTPADAMPGSGELFVRYIGHGEEVKSENVKLGGRSMDGFAPYFYSLIKGPWETGDKRLDPGKSGLDLMGRVTEKKRGSSFEGEGFWGKLFGAIKKITSDVLNKLYSQYDIRISPTLVYGDVVLTYFRVLDYVETGWLDKMKNTFTLNPNQFPLPVFPDAFLDSKPEHVPLATEQQLPPEWPEKFKEKFLKLPEDVRKPKFFKILQKTIFAQDTMGLDNKFLAAIPPGATFTHYNEALLNYLTPNPESRVRVMFNQLGQRGSPFLKNEVDRNMNNPAGPFKGLFALPLAEFNPFLFYVKATEYMSSLWDPRDPRRYLFIEKFYNQKEKCYDLNGIVYITGTEDLVLGNQSYRGKAIIITFGRVVFNGHFIKKKENDTPDNRAENANLTIVSLGGVLFDTTERVDAMVYSYIYPPMATPGKPFYVYGSLGTNNVEWPDGSDFLDKLQDGGRIVFDYTYHLPPDMPQKDRNAYYHVAITNEISRYGYSVRRDDNGLSDKD